MSDCSEASFLVTRFRLQENVVLPYRGRCVEAKLAHMLHKHLEDVKIGPVL